MKIHIKKNLPIKFIVDQVVNISKYYKVVFVCSNETQGQVWDAWSDLMYQRNSLEFYNIKFVESVTDLHDDEEKTMVLMLNPEDVTYGEFHKYVRYYQHVVIVGEKCKFEGYPGIEIK